MSQVNQVEPVIIDDVLLRKAVYEQIEPETSEIAAVEGVELHKVQSLRLDYKNILKIENLWAFEGLVKLQLDNNIIENIENIGFLKNLKWLDLSFNNISKITGLSNLVHLTDLTLFNNRITEIENLDALTELTVFSIGNNNLTKLENVAYLTKFKKLRVFNAVGNPIAKLPHYKNYTLAHLRSLKYLDYRLVEEEALATAKAQFIDDIMALEEEEKIGMANEEAARKLQELNAVYEKAHIKGIDDLFENMFATDPDYNKFKILSPEIINELKEQFGAKFNIILTDIKSMALQKTQEKEQELALLRKCIAHTLQQRNEESQGRIKAYQSLKKRVLRSISTLHDSQALDVAFANIRDETQKLSDACIGSEMVIVEQLEEVIKEFERAYTEICNGFLETCTSWFAKMRDLENDHSEKVAEALTSAFDRLIKGDLEELGEELRDILGDKDALLNGINSSHDFRQAKIDGQDDCLTAGIAHDIEATIQRVNEEELKRNRDFINEIMTFMDRCHADIDQAEDAL